MNDVEQRLRVLLDDALPQPTGIPVADVERIYRRRRRRHAVAASALATVAVVFVSALVVTHLPSSPASRLTAPSGPSSSAAPTGSGRTVTVNAVRFAVPDGWTVVQAGCGQPANHTVTVGVYGGSCPASGQDPAASETVALHPLYGRQYALGWDGERVDWRGQPGWLDQQAVNGSVEMTLALPWANGAITTRARTASAAQALLDRVDVQTQPTLAIPSHAAALFIQSLAGHDGDGLKRNITITDQHKISQLLSDLRAMPAKNDASEACDGQWSPKTALITVAQHTVALRFDTCSQATAGTGAAATPTSAVLDDIRHDLPDSGL